MTSTSCHCLCNALPRKCELAHNSFLSEYFGSDDKKDEIPDACSMQQLKILNKKFYEQKNILNGFKNSFQNERNNWNSEKMHLKMKIDLLNNSLKMERKKNNRLSIELAASGSNLQDNHAELKKERDKRNKPLVQQVIHNGSTKGMLKVQLDAAQDMSKDPATLFQKNATSVYPSNDNGVGIKQFVSVNKDSCSSWFRKQKESLIQIIESQKQRILEREARIKALEPSNEGTNTSLEKTYI